MTTILDNLNVGTKFTYEGVKYLVISIPIEIFSIDLEDHISVVNLDTNILCFIHKDTTVVII